MSRGVTLIELLLALVVGSLLAALAVPRFARVRDSLAVEAAAQRLVAAHQRARLLAILQSRETLLGVRADSLVLRIVSGTDSVTHWGAPGPAADGVALSGPARPMIFSPVGLMYGVSNGTWRFTRGAARRDVIVSRLGRVRMVRQ